LTGNRPRNRPDTGNRVNDSFQSVRDTWAASLRPLNLGIASTPRTGYWYVNDIGKHAAPITSFPPKIVFSVAGGKVRSIAGGEVPICEERRLIAWARLVSNQRPLACEARPGDKRRQGATSSGKDSASLSRIDARPISAVRRYRWRRCWARVGRRPPAAESNQSRQILECQPVACGEPAAGLRKTEGRRFQSCRARLSRRGSCLQITHKRLQDPVARGHRDHAFGPLTPGETIAQLSRGCQLGSQILRLSPRGLSRRRSWLGPRPTRAWPRRSWRGRRRSSSGVCSCTC
jgi:hypothetical protein